MSLRKLPTYVFLDVMVDDEHMAYSCSPGMTGSLCLTVTFLPPSYRPAKELVEKLTPFSFSERIIQHFCPTCGCQMLARCIADGDDPNSEVTWDVTTGSLEHIDGLLEWQGHEHIQDTLDGGFADMLLEINGKSMQRWPAHFGKHKELPVYWHSPSLPTVQPSSNDKLSAHCKCRGVVFYISRPSARSAVSQVAWPVLPSNADIDLSNVPSESETFWLRDKQTKFLAGLCACDSCRRCSGMETTFWAFVPTVDLSLDRDSKVPFTFNFGTVKKYSSSPGCYRYFCSKCGATCFYDADDRQFMKDVAIGLLDAPEGARAETWLGWRTNRLGYREDSVPRADSYSIGIEKGLKAWEEQRHGDDLSGPIRTGGAL